MLLDEIWNLVHNSSKGMYCISCFEKKLGRQLTAKDFNNSYLNNARTAPKSQLLTHRMSQ